jgi:hypothetical protein
VVRLDAGTCGNQASDVLCDLSGRRVGSVEPGGSSRPLGTLNVTPRALIRLDLQRLPIDLNQDGFRGLGEALWH